MLKYDAHDHVSFLPNCCRISGLTRAAKVLWSSAEALELLFSGPGVSATYRLLEQKKDGGSVAGKGEFPKDFGENKKKQQQFLGGFATEPFFF